MIVVKVGGSLYDHPRLGPGLRDYLEALAPAEVLLVPGGGDLADAVRRLDAVHRLGEAPSHWLALRSLGVTAAFLRHLLPPDPRVTVLDASAFATEDEGRPGSLPHTWDVTSDSVAARVAVVRKAERLVLLKSVDVPAGVPWTEAAARGWVDRYFPVAVAQAAFPVEVLNFRRMLGPAGD